MINTINCPKCNTTTSFKNSVDAVSFGCESCKSLFVKNQFDELKFVKQFQYNPVDIVLSLGAKATFDDEEYEIIGYVIKKTDGIYYWREYTLKSLSDKYVYLSEANGHWIILTQIESDIDFEGKALLDYEDVTYDKYGITSASVVGAYGFFDIKIPSQNVKMLEYINPPFIMSRENINGVYCIYQGEHISKADIKKVFNITDLPSQSGVGIVQPYYFNIYQTAIIFCVTMLLVLFTHKMINSERSDKQVLNEQIRFNDFNNKEYLSPSFNLVGTSAPLRIDLFSPVSNSWAYAGVSVINEETNEEIFAEKEIEYYSGYEDGYAWNEGSTSEKFYICGLGPGKYHLSVNTSKDVLDVTNEGMYIKAQWENASGWNFKFVIWTLVIVFILILIGRYLFEKSRWSDSEYSPYETEDY